MTNSIALSYKHHCQYRSDPLAGFRHTAGIGKPRRKACAYCGGWLITVSGYWTVQTWRGDGRYRLTGALKICRSESAADTWALDHRLGGNGEMCVRFIHADEPLPLTGDGCQLCNARVVHQVTYCGKYAV